MSKIHGQATIRFNGQVYETDDDASLMPGGLKNNDRMTGRKFFHNQTFVSSEVICKIPVTKDVSIKQFQEMTGVEITFQSDTGTTYVIDGAVQTGDVKLSGGADGGKVELTFKGPPAEEMFA